MNNVMNMWNEGSDEYFKNIRHGLDMIFDNAGRAFPAPVRKMINGAFPDLDGCRVIVPSSGDNVAAFGFHLLGAEVVSCDIAERQLYNAKKIADGYGWDINFIKQDSMELPEIENGEYDLVYTSNGVHVWIPDLPKMYKTFVRVLKQGGRYIMFETHPFIRPFDDGGDEVKIVKPYEDTGPNVTEGIARYAWRVQDIINAIINAGFHIERVEEFHPQINDYDDWFYGDPKKAEEDGYIKFDWKINPWAALPQWIGLSAVKK